MSVHGELSEYLSYRRATKVLLYITGLWPTKNPSLLQRGLPYFSAIVSSITTLAILGFVFHHITRVAIVVRGMSIGTSFLSGILKITLFLVHRERARELHFTLDDFFKSALDDEELRKHVLIGISTIRRLSLIFFVTVFIVIGGYVVTPMLIILNQIYHDIRPLKWLLIYPALYPWDIPNHGLIYQLQYTIETLASISLFCVTCGVDTLVAYYVFQMIAQLRVMSYRLTHLEDNTQIGDVIGQCVRQYEIVLRCRDTMQKIFGPIALWMMGTNAIVLCVLAFQISQMKSISILRGFFLLSYLIVKITQTYIYSWSGTTLMTQSEKYRRAVYDANWLKNKTVMSSIVILLCQKPLSLKAFRFFIISVDMFVKILNTTISYFFLLRTMEQKSN